MSQSKSPPMIYQQNNLYHYRKFNSIVKKKVKIFSLVKFFSDKYNLKKKDPNNYGIF